MPNGAGRRNAGGFQHNRNLHSREDNGLDISGISGDSLPDEPRLFVGNIPSHFTEADVVELFERVVPVVGINVKSGLRPNYKYAFLDFQCLEDCLVAIEELDNHPASKLSVRFPDRKRPRAQNAQETPKNSCSVCGSAASLLCSRCGVIYCSHLCQKFDWPTHRQECKAPEPLEPCPSIGNPASSQNTRPFDKNGPGGTSSGRFGPQEEPNKPRLAGNRGPKPKNTHRNAFGAEIDQKTPPGSAMGGAKPKENRFSGGRGGPNASNGRNVRCNVHGKEENWKEEESTELKPLQPLMLPNTGKFRVTVIHVVHPQEIWVHLDKNKAVLEDIATNLVKCQPNALRNPKVGDYCLAPYSDGTLNRAAIQAIRSQQAKVFYVDFGNTEVVDLHSLKTLCPQLRHQGCQAAKIGLAGIVGDFSHLTSCDIDGLTNFVMNTEEDIDILLLDMELIDKVIDGVPQAVLCDLEGLVINDVLPDLIPALGQNQPDPQSIPKPVADDVPPAYEKPNIALSEEMSALDVASQAFLEEKLTISSPSKTDDVPPGTKPGRMQSLLQNLYASIVQKQSPNMAISDKTLPVGSADFPFVPESPRIDTLPQNRASVAIAQESRDMPVFETPTVAPHQKQDDVSPASRIAIAGSLLSANVSNVAEEAETKNLVMLSSMARVKLDRPEYSVALVSAPRIPEIVVQLFSSVIVNALKAVQKALVKCDSEPVLNRMPIVGEVLAAKYEDDWFRASVDAVYPGEKEVETTYVDYGNSARVKFQDLRELPEVAVHRPICSHVVKLNDVPEDCSTNHQVVALITENIDVAFDMKVVDASLTPPLVDLDNSETGKSLATTIRELLSPKVKPAFRPPRMPPPGKSLRTPPTSAVQNPFSTNLDASVYQTPQAIPEPSLVKEKSILTLENPEEIEPPKLLSDEKREEASPVVEKEVKSEKSTLKEVSESEKTVIEALLEVKKNESEVANAEIATDGPIKRFWYSDCKFSLPCTGQDLALLVVSADDPGQVLLTHPKDEYLQKVDELAPQIRTYCESTAPDPTFWPESGEIVLAYCAKSEDWARALVLYEEELDLFQVMFADFGNKEQVPLAKIRPIPEQFMELPLLAATCHLKGLDDASEQVVEKVKELLPPNALVVGHVLGCHEAYYEVEIPSVVEALQNAGLM